MSDTSTTGYSNTVTVEAGKLSISQERIHQNPQHDKPVDISTLLPNTLLSPASPNPCPSAPKLSANESLSLDYVRDLPDQRRNSAQSSAPAVTSSQDSAPEPSKTLRIPGTTLTLPNKPLAAYDYFQGCMAQVDRIRDTSRVKPRPKSTRLQSILIREHTRMASSRLDTHNRPVNQVADPSRVRTAAAARRTSLPQIPTTSLACSTTREQAPKGRPTSSRRAQTRKSQSQTTFLNEASPPKKHKRSAPSKRTPSKDDDLFWRDLPNFCPSSINAQLSILTARWMTRKPLDIDDQVDVKELHKLEYDVCRKLRLKPVQYLAIKRRFFIAKEQFSKEGRTFTKTEAQKVTNIDVNKSSQLWEAFNNAGWFDHKHFHTL
ncbi:hypothetical protein LTR86_010411 [Recurvomyces mirabilis]|nr:hypothetical protein LTR86_010411 [Recurvomyces mirabilis]